MSKENVEIVRRLFEAVEKRDAAVVTGEYKINYLKTAVSVKLMARASVIHAGRNQIVCRCEIYSVGADGTKNLCATAQGAIVRVNQTPENI